MTQSICGIDVSSLSLEAAIGAAGLSCSFPNTPEGIASLAAFCREHQVTLVAMEATGGYERQAWALLSEQGIDAVVFGPGFIDQAHAADEYVEIAELEAARAAFTIALEACAR